MKRLEDAEAFSDPQGCLVGQHHPAGADADAASDVGNVADHEFRSGTRNQRGVVVLGEPVTRVAKVVGQTGKVERVLERLAAG